MTCLHENPKVRFLNIAHPVTAISSKGMSFLKSAGPIESAKDILKLNPNAGIALVHYHTAVLRQSSEISAKERELIAAYVSGLNACQYCHGIHSITAETFGVEVGTLSRLLENPETAPIDEKLKPMLAYAKKLTLEPSKMAQADADAILGAGWSEQAIHDLVNVVCLFNFMNRLVEGHGLKGTQALYETRGQALHDSGYDPLLDVLSKA